MSQNVAFRTSQPLSAVELAESHDDRSPAESEAHAIELLSLAYEAGLRRGWSAHRQMESIYPDAEFAKWLLKRSPLELDQGASNSTSTTR